MKIQTNIIQHIEDIINSIKQMEKNSEVFSELKNISNELEVLEQYVKTTLDTLESNFNSFVKQISILSELVDFQRNIMSYKNSDKLMNTIFDFLQQNINFDHGFIAFKLKDEDPEYTVISKETEYIDTYREFIKKPELEIIHSIVRERELAYLISDVRQFSDGEIEWDMLSAKSLILFPVKIRGNYHGLGVLVRHHNAFELHDQSFVNLIVGIISLLIYQHYYFAKLKTRLFKQFRLRKMLEEVKYSEYFEKGPLYIFTLDPRGIILHTNTTAIKNLKFEEERIIGEKFTEIIPKAYRSAFQKVLGEAEEDEIQYFRSPIYPTNRHESILEFFITPINLQNNFNLVLIFALEITQIYYKDFYARRNEMMDELDQFSRTLIGNFNNLLSTIVPNISLLRTQLPKDHKFQKNLEAVEKSTKRSSNLIQKFLNYDLEDFEKPEHGNLNKVIRSFIESRKKEIPNHIKIKYNLNPGIKEIEFYPLRLRQLLKILLENSIQALENNKNPQIQFSTNILYQEKDGLVADNKFYLDAGEYLELSIQDNGCGIPEKSLTQVFKPFYSTRVKNEGVGLGLFIAYNIIRDMKGRIFIDSKYEQFTNIHIYLPIKEEKFMETFAVEKQSIPKEETKKQPTVLVVDDEYNIRSMLREIMEMNGLKVYTAGNGRDGVDVFQRFKEEIDLVVLDMVMPVLDGRAAFEEIRKINSQQKIFIISGYSQREDLEDMLRKGAIGFLRKPFQVNEIVSKVKEILKIKE